MQMLLLTMQHCYTTMTNSTQVLTSSWPKSNMTQIYGVDWYGLQAEDKEPYIVNEADLPENKVRLIDTSGNATKFKRFAPSKGIKMLGSHKAAILQENTEFEYIQAKAEMFLRALLSCYLQQHDVVNAYITIHKPSISYFLCSKSF
eukprot:10984053-Ditylum_brightwellii.AAC.1